MIIFALKCLMVNFDFGFGWGKLASLTPKISGPFWWILDLKHVRIDMWANDKNEMMFSYFQL
jgi:hypothetical protein